MIVNRGGDLNHLLICGLEKKIVYLHIKIACMATQNTSIVIDLKDVIASKNPRVAKYIPNFLIKRLNRFLHIAELNELLKETQGFDGVAFADKSLELFQINVDTIGLDNIDPNGRYLFAANHPLGGFDGIALISKIGKVRPDVAFPVNDFLMYLPNLQSVFVPIDKVGNNAKNRRTLNETFASERTLLYFPAGLCSRKQHGKIMDLEWKNTFVTRSKKSGRDIVPVFVDARNSNKFYRIANIRKKLGIKFNFEMFWLIDEVFKQKKSSFRIIIGKPIKISDIDNSRSDREWAKRIKEHVYELKNNPKKIFEK